MTRKYCVVIHHQGGSAEDKEFTFDSIEEAQAWIDRDGGEEYGLLYEIRECCLQGTMGVLECEKQTTPRTH